MGGEKNKKTNEFIFVFKQERGNVYFIVSIFFSSFLYIKKHVRFPVKLAITLSILDDIFFFIISFKFFFSFHPLLFALRTLSITFIIRFPILLFIYSPFHLQLRVFFLFVMILIQKKRSSTPNSN